MSSQIQRLIEKLAPPNATPSARALEFFYRLQALQNDPPIDFCNEAGLLPADELLLRDYLYPFTSVHPVAKKNHNTSESDIAQEWHDELDQVYAMRLRVAHRLRRAIRKRDEREADRLQNQLIDWQRLSPEWKSPPAADKNVIPLTLRNSYDGQTIWRAIRSCAESGSALDLIKLVINGIRSANRARYFAKVSSAFEYIESFEPIKQDLLKYRNSLRWSATPGKRRHTAEQIKKIVAPDSTIAIPVLRNMLGKLGVPFIRIKAGRKNRRAGTKN
jgi:hypothetical protein